MWCNCKKREREICVPHFGAIFFQRPDLQSIGIMVDIYQAPFTLGSPSTIKIIEKEIRESNRGEDEKEQVRTAEGREREREKREKELPPHLLVMDVFADRWPGYRTLRKKNLEHSITHFSFRFFTSLSFRLSLLLYFFFLSLYSLCFTRFERQVSLSLSLSHFVNLIFFSPIFWWSFFWWWDEPLIRFGCWKLFLTGTRMESEREWNENCASSHYSTVWTERMKREEKKWRKKRGKKREEWNEMVMLLPEWIMNFLGQIFEQEWKGFFLVHSDRNEIRVRIFFFLFSFSSSFLSLHHFILLPIFILPSLNLFSYFSPLSTSSFSHASLIISLERMRMDKDGGGRKWKGGGGLRLRRKMMNGGKVLNLFNLIKRRCHVCKGKRERKEREKRERERKERERKGRDFKLSDWIKNVHQKILALNSWHNYIVSPRLTLKCDFRCHDMTSWGLCSVHNCNGVDKKVPDGKMFHFLREKEKEKKKERKRERERECDERERDGERWFCKVNCESNTGSKHPLSSLSLFLSLSLSLLRETIIQIMLSVLTFSLSLSTLLFPSFIPAFSPSVSHFLSFTLFFLWTSRPVHVPISRSSTYVRQEPRGRKEREMHVSLPYRMTHQQSTFQAECSRMNVRLR